MKSNEYMVANAEKARAAKRDWNRRNPESINEAARRYRLAHDGRTSATTVKKRNPESYARMVSKWAKRRADRVSATPAWFDAEKAHAIYMQAGRMRASGFDVHVDHILPLKGELVCGLHVHSNLRIIPARENIAKGAKLLPELI